MNDPQAYILEFLKSERLLALGTSHRNIPWVAHLFFVLDDDLNFYFVSHKDTSHSQHISENPTVSFSIGWYDPFHLEDRRIIQGKGHCELVTDEEVKKNIIQRHNELFPTFANHVSQETLLPEESPLGLYRIRPSLMRYWDGHFLNGERPGGVNIL